MAETIRERCIRRLQATLQTIRTDAAYNNTVRSVQRCHQDGQSYVDLPVIVIYEGDEDVEEGPEGIGAESLVTRTLEIELGLGMTQDTDADPRSADEAMGTLRADVQRALALDERLNGLAIRLREISSTAVERSEQMPRLAIAMTYELQYRHRFFDPTAAE